VQPPPISHLRYSAEEVNELLDILMEVKPIGMMGWERVWTKFSHAFPARECNAESLHQKFKDLQTALVPTGNSTIPNPVSHAINIGRLILTKMHGRNLDKHYSTKISLMAICVIRKKVRIVQRLRFWSMIAHLQMLESGP